MASKTLLLLGFVLVAMFLVSSEVAARELAEETKEKKTEKGALEDTGRPITKGPLNPGYTPCGSHSPGKPYVRCLPNHCQHGCCRSAGIYGGCQCCTHAGEVPDPEYQAEPRS